MFIVFVQSDVPCTRKQILKHELETFVFIIPFIFSPMTTNFFFFTVASTVELLKHLFFFFPAERITTVVKPSFCKKMNFVSIYMALPKILSFDAIKKIPGMWRSISGFACWYQFKWLNQIKVSYCFLVGLSLSPKKL